MLVQRRRDSRAALRLMRKLLKKQGFTPNLLVTDKLRSYASACRQLRLTCRHEQGAETEQSGREFSSGGTTTRAQVAALQISQIRAAFPEHARRGPQHFQPSTPPDLPIDPADLQSRGSGAMVRRCRSRMRPDQPIPPFDSTPVTVTKPTRGAFASPATRVTRDGRACRQSAPRPSAQCSILLAELL